MSSPARAAGGTEVTKTPLDSGGTLPHRGVINESQGVGQQREKAAPDDAQQGSERLTERTVRTESKGKSRCYTRGQEIPKSPSPYFFHPIHIYQAPATGQATQGLVTQWRTRQAQSGPTLPVGTVDTVPRAHCGGCSHLGKHSDNPSHVKHRVTR